MQARIGNIIGGSGGGGADRQYHVRRPVTAGSRYSKKRVKPTGAIFSHSCAGPNHIRAP